MWGAATLWKNLDEWKALVAKGEQPDASLSLRKAYVADVTVKDGDASRTIDFTISTGSVDREKDVIDPAGWKLAPFKANPIILWAHDYSMPPIGRAKRISVVGGAVKATAEFAPADVYPFAETIYRLLRGGFLRATSVGFRPLKYAYNAERGGVDFEAQELLEFSVVPVPANAECLMDGKAAGIDVEPLKAWAEKTLAALGVTYSIPKMSSGEAANAGRMHQMVKTAHAHASDAHDMAGEMLQGGKAMSDAESQMVASAHKSLGDAKAHLQSAMDACSTMSGGKSADAIIKTVPSNPNSKKAPEDEAWSAPGLKDFTDGSWDDLTDPEKRKIAQHFAWADEMPPEKFENLKLPHHRPSDGAVVFRGVVAAAGRLNQTSGIDEKAVKAHLAAHYRQFDKDVPWESSASASAAVAKDDAAAEMVEYELLKTMFGQAATWVASGSSQVAALIAEEATEPPEDGSPAHEDAEELEESRIEAIKTVAGQLAATASGIAALADDMLEDEDDEGEPGMMLMGIKADGLSEDVVLALSDEPEPDTKDGGIEIDADDVRAAIAEALRGTVNDGVRSAVNALRGRVD